MARYCLLILLWFCAPAWATDYYVCDCLTGAHASCSAGSNANAGTSSSAPKQTLAGYTWSGETPTFTGGDRVRVCNGGSLSISGLQINLNNTTRANQLTIEPYAPSSGATGTPIFRANGANDGLIFGAFGITEPQGIGHYVVNGINFDGLGTGNHAIYLFGVASMTIENSTLQRWGFGIEIACTTVTCTTSPGPASNNVTIRNTLISRNTNMGILGGAVNLVVKDNHFDRNSNVGALTHNFYLTHSRGVLIAGNIFENPGNADSGGTVCAAGNLTMHGLISGVVIENNRIVNTTVAAGCGGISITPGYDTSPILTEDMREIVVRGNRILNGPIRIACAPRVKVENNSFVFTVQPLAAPFTIPAEACTTKTAPVDVPDTGAVIRNNSTLFDFLLTDDITAYALSGNDGIGSNVVFTGNLVRFQNTGGANSRTCFQYSATSAYTTTERNGCSNFTSWSTAHSTLAAAQAAGYDTGSLNSDPSFAATPASGNNWSMKLGGSSPYLAAGSATHGPRRSIDGWNRPTTPSIGAFDANNP